MRILGLDPGFASIGYCLAEYNGSAMVVDRLGLIVTMKSSKKIPSFVDNYDRSQVIAEGLEALVLRDSAITGRVETQVDCIAAEAMSVPRNAATGYKLGMAWGVIAGLAYGTQLPMVQITPKELKHAVAGKRSASKEQVEQRLREFYPEIVEMLEVIPPSKREHPCDALGAIVAALNSEVIKMGVRGHA